MLLCEKICDTRILYIPSGVIYELEDLENQIEAYRADALVKIIKYYQEILKFLVIIYEGFENDITAVRLSMRLCFHASSTIWKCQFFFRWKSIGKNSY